jgi:hypothetical protein
VVFLGFVYTALGVVILANRRRLTDFTLSTWEAILWQPSQSMRKFSLFLQTLMGLVLVIVGPVVVWTGLFR